MQQNLSNCSILRSECVWKPFFKYLLGTQFLLQGYNTTSISIGRHSLQLGFLMQNAFPCKLALGNMWRNQSKCCEMYPAPDARCSNASILVPFSDLNVWGSHPWPSLLGTQSFCLRGSTLLPCVLGDTCSNCFYSRNCLFLQASSMKHAERSQSVFLDVPQPLILDAAMPLSLFHSQIWMFVAAVLQLACWEHRLTVWEETR